MYHISLHWFSFEANKKFSNNVDYVIVEIQKVKYSRTPTPNAVIDTSCQHQSQSGFAFKKDNSFATIARFFNWRQESSGIMS